MIKQVFLIDKSGIYLDTVLLEADNNTYYDGVDWTMLNFEYVETVPPHGKVVKWDGSKWTIIEEYPKEPPLPVTPSEQDKLNSELIKQNAELKAEIDKQKQLNSQVLLELAKLKQGGGANV